MPLQKSFSDQSHSTRQSGRHWRSNKSYSASAQPLDAQTPKPTKDGLPTTISAATKDKLSAFAFGSKPAITTSTMVEDKENLGSTKDPRQTSRQASQNRKRASKSSSQQSRSPRSSQNIPKTPAARLALPDLISMVDVREEQEEDDTMSPDGKVLWDHEQNAYSFSVAANSDTRRGKRKRKRPRTSSPASSPNKESFNLKRMSQTLKTPQAPANFEPWDRYSLNADKLDAEGHMPALERIMNTSSPQANSGGRSGRMLKKSVSCGMEWPSKRRKLGDASTSAGSLFSGPNAGRSKSHLSVVSEILEKASESKAESSRKSPRQAHSSSLPNPGPSADGALENSSPLRHLSKPAPFIILDEEPEEEDVVMQEVGVVKPAKAETDIPTAESSDYGDFDDDDLDEGLLAVEKAETQASQASPTGRIPQASATVPPVPARNTGETVAKQETRVEDNQNRTSRSPSTAKESDDEFGDFDDDLVDLADIAAKYDDNTRQEKSAAGPISFEGAGAKTPEVADTKNGILKAEEADDEFGDDFGDDFDFDAAEAAATQSAQQSAGSIPPSSQKARTIQRYLVTNVLETQYEDDKGKPRPQKILLVEVENNKKAKTVYLRDAWFDTPVNEKAYIHIIGQFNNNQCIIDDLQNMIILHPDHLISSTVVADSFSCTRRAVLQDRVKATSDKSKPLVYGTILHELFQAAMIANRWDTTWLSAQIETIAIQHLEDLYAIRIPIIEAVKELMSKLSELQSWAELFVSSKPKRDATVKAPNGGKATMCVSKLLDVEEHMWSPMYGLKGNIDATVQVTMKDGKEERTLTVPFEVKTGKNQNAAHRAQTALYNLLLSDRYDIDIAYGILYYMETSETIRIPAIRHELRHMVMQRNELACFVRERDNHLPEMAKKEPLCKNCYAKTPCFIYHKLVDDGDAMTSGVGKKFDEVVQHLTPTHKEFFIKWDNLLTKEEKESLKFRRELWTMLSSEREKLGRCFANVVIKEGSAYEDIKNPKINRFKYVLIKQNAASGFSFLESQIIIGEPIVISDEKGHFALANGYVTNVRKKEITVEVDRRLHNARIRQPGFDEVDNQVFASIMEVAPEGCTQQQMEGKISSEPILYRLDKDEFSNGMATVRNNLIQVMAEGPFGSREIRNLVVDLVAPRFKMQASSYQLKKGESINIDQRRAIEKVLSAQDYALVLGMPGTGKTTTIAHIIRALVLQGKSVLLTSYTHTAVDNILLKLKDDAIPTLRLGAPAKIHPEVQKFAKMAATPKESFEELHESWHDSPIVATTCLGINHGIFNERTFDYCIVDEASQITLPVCLGPIRMARTFILVGDHNQLPPLVQNEEARTGGLDISLFKYLSDKHPESVVNLEHQYRMCEEVMTLSNNLIYNGRLKCGTEAVANRSIHIPDMSGLSLHHHTPSSLARCNSKDICLGGTKPHNCWLRDLLHPQTKVRFVNTDTLLPASREEAKGNRIVNPTEAQVVVQLVEALLSVGVPADSIGVMTHYRSQLALLKHGLRGRTEVEMHTADRFQGRDKEVVVLSLVRSNEAGSIGELLRDWRRINVAFTRAKTKLIVVGSQSTLKGSMSKQDGGVGCGNEEMVARFVGLMEVKGWIYDLPKGALEMHIFEDVSTQVNPSASVGSQKRPHQWKEIGAEKKEAVKRARGMGQENTMRQAPKRAQAGPRAVLNNRPVLKDIYNDLVG